MLRIVSVKLYRFDDVGENFDLVPLAARRALDVAGRKLSLESFRNLSLSARRALTTLGSEDRVDVSAVLELVGNAVPAAEIVATLPEPSDDAPPETLVAALGPERPLPHPSWRALVALDRYVLVKVLSSKTPGRLDEAYQEIIGRSAWSSHLAPDGGVRMVRVTDKPATLRSARAESWVTMNGAAFRALAEHAAPKGDVLGTARLAGIMATKKTSDLIPLCHPLALSHVALEFDLEADSSRLHVRCAVETTGPTGVEMEALTGASIAALTVYDMLKSLDRAMTLGPCRLLEKSGGRSGDYSALDSTSSPTTSEETQS